MAKKLVTELFLIEANELEERWDDDANERRWKTCKKRGYLAMHSRDIVGVDVCAIFDSERGASMRLKKEYGKLGSPKSGAAKPEIVRFRRVGAKGK